MDERLPEPVSRPEALGLRGTKGPRKKKARRRKPPGWGLFVAWQVVFLGGGAVAGVAVNLSRLPDVSTLQHWVPTESTQILDYRGQLIANIHGEENREVVPLAEIPQQLQQAVIAVEDDRFYQHRGINLRGILRALVADLAERGRVEGGSTITQQLAKNLFLTSSRSISRKLADAWLAIQIEHRFSKPQILEMYLNQVYWGHNCYGIQAASHHYFNKTTRQLSLSEAAMLAFVLRGPERFSPIKHYDAAHKGMRVALQRMVSAGFLTTEEASKAATVKPKVVTNRENFSFQAPYFTNYLLSQLMNRYPSDMVMRGGLRVRASLDLALQTHAEQVLRKYLIKEGKRLHFSQGAILVLDPRTGYIRAMVGGKDYATSKFNRVIQAFRQPGSSFKPFVYLTAFSQGIAPTMVMNDGKVSYDAGAGQIWAPMNFGNEYWGDMSLRKALERSNNVIAVKLLNRVGIGHVIETAHRLGIQSNLNTNLSLALGSSEVTPMELASAYSVFAADGMRCEPQAYSVVEDRAGVILERYIPHPTRVFEAEPIRMLNDVLTGVVSWGTGYAAKLDRPAAGKTGTTSDHRDAWFVGYTPDLVCLVWIGNDDNSKMVGGTTGGGVCAPIWREVMTFALTKTPATPFLSPKPLPPKARVAPATRSAAPKEFYVPAHDETILSPAPDEPLPAAQPVASDELAPGIGQDQ